MSLNGAHCNTDGEGRFEFPEAETEGVTLAVFGGAEFPLWRRPLAELEDIENLEVQLQRQAEFFVELTSEAERAGSFELLDAAGDSIALHQNHGLSMFFVYRGQIDEGRSPVYRAPQGVATLVLKLDKVEVERVEVNLRSGEVQRIDL